MFKIKISAHVVAALFLSALFSTLPVTAATSGLSSLAGQIGVKQLDPITDEERERARNYFTDTQLTTQHGDKVAFYSDVLDGHVVMINVMYTSCPGACPLQTQKLSQVSKDLGKMYANDIRFVSLTNDAERDTPEALLEFAKKNDVNLDGWTFLTGVKEEIDPVINKLGLFAPNFEEHTSMILIGNTRTGHWKKIKPNVPFQSITLKLQELVSEG
jgi:cytochrome oxidase Cu insertion factor (SCO1/SenC/PrrC family)